MSVDIVAKAKADLEAAGQEWNTDCDAYKITNLSAQRAGWKVLEKLSGENCQNRTKDVVIVDGRIIDCLQNAGPPVNANTPVWLDQGPQNANQVAKEPYNWPDPADSVDPPTFPPDTIDNVLVLRALEDITATQAEHTHLLEQQRNQSAADTARIIENDNANTEKIQQQLHQIVEDAEKTLKEVLAAYIISNRPDAGSQVSEQQKKK